MGIQHTAACTEMLGTNIADARTGPYARVCHDKRYAPQKMTSHNTTNLSPRTSLSLSSQRIDPSSGHGNHLWRSCMHAQLIDPHHARQHSSQSMSNECGGQGVGPHAAPITPNPDHRGRRARLRDRHAGRRRSRTRRRPARPRACPARWCGCRACVRSASRASTETLLPPTGLRLRARRMIGFLLH